MSQLKIGDKVKVIGHKTPCGHECNGKIRIITTIHGTPAFAYTLNCEHIYGICADEVIKYKELNNEIDFLNAFQENFREGV